MELYCLYLLVVHGALDPGHGPLVAATLDWVAARLGYASRCGGRRARRGIAVGGVKCCPAYPAHAVPRLFLPRRSLV